MNQDQLRRLSVELPREVIADLLPLYAAGEASPPTIALVEEYLKHDDELRAQVQSDSLGQVEKARLLASAPSPDVALRSLRRTRALLRWQRLTYGWALAFSVASLSGVGFLQNGYPAFHFFIRDYPHIFVPCVSIAVSLWANYIYFRWRLRKR
jgi:hypothetical protein